VDESQSEHTIVGYALLVVIGLVVIDVLHRLIGTAGIGLLLLAIGVILSVRGSREDRCS